MGGGAADLRSESPGMQDLQGVLSAAPGIPLTGELKMINVPQWKHRGRESI